MSDTNIGRDFPKTPNVKPAAEEKKRAVKETPKEPESEQQQKADLNLNRDPAAVVGMSQVKKTGEKPYVYDPKNTANDLDNLRYMHEAFNSTADKFAEELGVNRDEAILLLAEQIVHELGQPAA